MSEHTQILIEVRPDETQDEAMARGGIDPVIQAVITAETFRSTKGWDLDQRWVWQLKSRRLG
jgi:hypothetical protein